MEEYKISVIVPVYKVEKYLNKCVDSIINQTYKNLEIILVDDGSPDNCGKICDEYSKKDNRIKVIHKENGGVSSARNVGLDLATGDYIGFVDSDDWIETDMYEYLLNICIKFNCQVSRCNYIECNDYNKTYKKEQEKISIFENDDIIIDLVTGNWNEGVLWNKLYKKSLLQGIVFDEKLSCSEDLLFNYYILKNTNKLVCSNQIKYNYIIRENTITKGQFCYGAFDIVNVAREIAGNEKNNINTYEYCIKRIVNCCFLLINTCFIKDSYIEKVNDMRDIIIKNKYYIFNSKVFDFKTKIKFIILNISPMFYKFLVEFKF